MANMNGPDRPAGSRLPEDRSRNMNAASSWWIAALAILAIVVVLAWGLGSNRQTADTGAPVNTAQNTEPPTPPANPQTTENTGIAPADNNAAANNAPPAAANNNAVGNPDNSPANAPTGQTP